MDRMIPEDFSIKIGIQDGKVCMLDWSELSLYRSFQYLNEKEIKALIKSYLKEAQKFIK